MWEDLKARVLECGTYIANSGATVRQAAKVFHLGKSTVHKDMTERLPKLDEELYRKVRRVLKINLSERHLRGGLATRQKYAKRKQKTEQN